MHKAYRGQSECLIGQHQEGGGSCVGMSRGQCHPITLSDKYVAQQSASVVFMTSPASLVLSLRVVLEVGYHL